MMSLTRPTSYLQIQFKCKYHATFNFFLPFPQVAQKLLELYVRLKELGHPEYLEPMVTRTLHCYVLRSTADETVSCQTTFGTGKTSTLLLCRYERLRKS